jgi:DNA-directed RNA polymerase subunit F
MEEIKKKQAISISEVREILSRDDPESMDQIQRWMFDYSTKFDAIDAERARRMKRRLVEECDLTEEEAVEIVNILPTTLAELRSFTFGWKKLILAETLERMQKIIKENI